MNMAFLFVLISITILMVILFLLIIEILFLLTNKSIYNISRAYKLIKNIKNLKYVGNSYYYNFFYTDEKDFWILQYSPRDPKIFRLYKWEEEYRDNKHFYCQLGQPISGILFFIITNKLDEVLIPLVDKRTNYDIRKEEDVIKTYKEFKRISKRKNLIQELTQ